MRRLLNWQFICWMSRMLQKIKKLFLSSKIHEGLFWFPPLHGEFLWPWHELAEKKGVDTNHSLRVSNCLLRPWIEFISSSEGTEVSARGRIISSGNSFWSSTMTGRGYFWTVCKMSLISCNLFRPSNKSLGSGPALESYEQKIPNKWDILGTKASCKKSSWGDEGRANMTDREKHSCIFVPPAFMLEPVVENGWSKVWVLPLIRMTASRHLGAAVWTAGPFFCGGAKRQVDRHQHGH